MLKIKLAKKAEAKPKQIKVNVGSEKTLEGKSSQRHKPRNSADPRRGGRLVRPVERSSTVLTGGGKMTVSRYFVIERLCNLSDRGNLISSRQVHARSRNRSDDSIAK